MHGVVSRTPRAYFDELYSRDGDPWGFERRWYEERKYALTLASLPHRRYRSGFEPGCSVGVLTEALASRCDALLAADHVPAAVAAARRRVGSLAHVRIEERTVPDWWPEGPFDLLVLSELCYYFDGEELAALVRSARGSLAPEATIVAVHWRGETDYPLSGDEAHRRLARALGSPPAVHHAERELLLDVWELP